MAIATQQKAKSLSQQYLSGGKSTIGREDVNAIKELGDYFGNKSNARQDQMYQRQLQDNKAWAERASQVQSQYQGRDIQGQNTRTAMQSGGQAQSSALGSQSSMYNAQTQRLGAIGSQSQAGGDEFAKSLMNPLYKPDISKIDAERFNQNSEAMANKAFGGSSSGGFIGGGSSYGMNGTTDPYDYNMGSSSVNRGMYNASKMADFNLQQANTARNNRLFSEANAAGDIARDKAQTKNQAYLASVNYRNQVDMMNRQGSLESQEAQRERASRERTAAMQAQSSMYGAMFSSFRSNPGDYQYWGGKV